MSLTPEPPCPFCGIQSFRQEESTASGVAYCRTRTCLGCGAKAALATHRDQGVLAFFPAGTVEERGWKHHFPTDFEEWCSGPLESAWAVREKERAAHETQSWLTWLSDVFYVHFPELRNAPRFSESQISYPDCPPEAQAWYDNRVMPPLPPRLRTPVYPPQAPPYKMFYRSGGAWFPVDTLYSASLEAPPHPEVVQNTETLNAAFRDVGSLLDIDIQPVPAKNQYGGRVPWFSFNIGSTTFTVGRRRRVVAIQASSTEGLHVEEIRDRALQDNVTYIAEGPETRVTLAEILAENPSISDLEKRMLGAVFPPEGKVMRLGGSNDPRPVAHQVEVHAWNQDQLRDYLTLLGRAAQAG